MSSPDDLVLAGILPQLADDVYAKAACELRLHFGGRVVEPGDSFSKQQVEQAPHVDIDGEGVFTLVAVALHGSAGAGGADAGTTGGSSCSSSSQELVWLVSNVPDFDLDFRRQIAEYKPPVMAASYQLVFLLYRQPEDEPLDVAVPAGTASSALHKLDEAAIPTNMMGPEMRQNFHAKQLAAAYHLGLPVAVAWVWVE